MTDTDRQINNLIEMENLQHNRQNRGTPTNSYKIKTLTTITDTIISFIQEPDREYQGDQRTIGKPLSI